jgi:asparagine synthase (glutamine-hydrolysing)
VKVTVGVLDKHGDSVVTRVLDVLQSFDFGQVSHFGVVTPNRCVLEKALGIINRQGLETSAMLGYISSRPAVSSNYEFQQLGDAAAAFEGRIYKPVAKTALTEQLSKEPSHCEVALQTILEQSDGDYAFWLLREGWIAAGRDPIGVQPLYYGENRDIAAYATNKTALWQLGIETPQSFPPGTLGFADKEGFKFKSVRTLSYNPPKQISLDEAADQLLTLLTESLKRRVAGLEKAAVAFSGGLDSSLVAFLAKKLGVKVQLLHVSLENQPETEEAIQAAEALDLPMSVHLFKDSDVEAALPRVVELIEEADPVKAAIGVPFYWTAQKALESKYRAVLAGQGADELFGGYQRYVTENCNGGAAKVAQTMFGDVVNIHQSNLERDLKITGSFDVELRLPFACFELAEFAMGLPVECKMEPKADTLRKLVLRKAAQNAGTPNLIVVKPKKAVQYSTGISNAIKRIAKAQDKTVGEYIDELFERTKTSS